MRITVNKKELETLLNALDFFMQDKEVAKDKEKLAKKIRTETMKNSLNVKARSNKADAVEKAREAKSKATKEKLISSINMMRLESKKITKSSLHEDSKVSRVTINRYWESLKGIIEGTKQ